MIQRIRKYFFEALAILLGVAFVTMLLYLYFVNPDELMTRGTVMFGLFFDGIAIYFVLRKLWRTKWRARVMPSLQKAFEKIARIFRIVQTKLGISPKNGTTVLKGKSKIIFDTKTTVAQPKRLKKPAGWKNLQNDKERLGYLYRRMIDTNIHKGLPVFSSETPNEIREKKDFGDCENQIFDLYVANRYKDDISLDIDMLDDLKKEVKNL